MGHDVDVRYRIDARDEIVFVDEGWRRFADANGGARLLGDGVLGRPIWDFICDASTRELYRKILVQVRQGLETRFMLRCDGPSCRRLLEMTIRRGDSDAVDFSTRTLRLEEREPVLPLSLAETRPRDWVRVCSWCNRVGVAPGEWAEVEEAVVRLRLFELDRVPRLTHGICEECLAIMTRTLDERSISL